MAIVQFTPNLARHVDCPVTEAGGTTVRTVLDAVFEENPALRGYVLDDQAGLRQHMSVFVDGRQVKDRAGLSDAVSADSRIFVAQALSGG
jgi:molybdopterin synthase sulfur carrier subunit